LPRDTCLRPALRLGRSLPLWRGSLPRSGRRPRPPWNEIVAWRRRVRRHFASSVWLA